MEGLFSWVIISEERSGEDEKDKRKSKKEKYKNGKTKKVKDIYQ